MADYTIPVKNEAFVFFVSLPSQADTKLAKANPTLAAGDVKVQTDDGSIANITTLPTGAASSLRVKVSLSASEMNGDNIWVQFSDAAGAEWCDVTVCIQTATRGVDDLAFPATSGRSMLVETDGMVHADLKEWLGVAPLALTAQRVEVLVGSMAASVLNAAAIATDAITSSKVADGFLTAGKFAAGAFDAVWSVATRLLTAGTNIVLAKGTGVTGFNDLSAAQVNAEADQALADYDAPTRAEATSDKNEILAAIPSSPPSPSAIADQVWDEARADHVGAGSFGEGIASLLSRITSTLFTGITSLAQWLGAMAGKQVANSTARTELRATGAGSGTFDETTDSQEAIRDTAPLGTAMRGTDNAALASVCTETRLAELDPGNVPAAADAAAASAAAADTKAGNLQTRTPDALVGGGMKSRLVSTGLDDIPTTAPAGVASTFREMLVQTWRRLFKRATFSATQQRTFADDGVTPLTTQTMSDDGTTQVQGPST